MRERSTYVSFGDDGTTATLNHDGQLMQITQFLGVGTSGFFCVDRSWIAEPSFVQYRAQQLADPAVNDVGIGCNFDVEELPKELDPFYNMKPVVEFVRDRWPRYIADTEDATSTTQFFVHEGTVFDVWTCTWKKGFVPALPDLVFHSSYLLIRELDFTNISHKFNVAEEDSEEYTVCLGPDGKSVVLVHAGIGSERTEGLQEDIGLFVSCFVNGNLQRFEQVEGPPGSRRPGFKIKLQGDNPGMRGSQTIEFATAYRLQVLPKGYHQIPKLVSLPGYHTLEELLAPSPYTKLKFSSDSHLDFVIRRNLEHILSVCSVPIRPARFYDGVGKEGGTTEQEIALTCGDLSGHRLVNSASL